MANKARKSKGEFPSVAGLYLTAEARAKLERMSDESGLTMSHIMRALIDQAEAIIPHIVVRPREPKTRMTTEEKAVYTPLRPGWE